VTDSVVTIDGFARVGKDETATLSLTNSTLDLVDAGRMMFFYANATLIAENSTIRFNGQDDLTSRGFRNALTDPAKFDGEGLTVVATTSTGQLSEFEAAGQDLGITYVGHEGNFSLDELVIGVNAGSAFHLVDEQENMAGDEALYVDLVTVDGDVTLQIVGTRLYYRSLVLNGNTLTVTDGTSSIPLTSEPARFNNTLGLVHIPEPASLGLLALGLVLTVWRRR
jgi:hypothetical protein